MSPQQITFNPETVKLDELADLINNSAKAMNQLLVPLSVRIERMNADQILTANGASSDEITALEVLRATAQGVSLLMLLLSRQQAEQGQRAPLVVPRLGPFRS